MEAVRETAVGADVRSRSSSSAMCLVWTKSTGTTRPPSVSNSKHWL
jgi:hypothetical protein